MPIKSVFKSHKLLAISISLLLGFSLYVFIDTQGFYDLIDRSSLWVRSVFGQYYLALGLFSTLFLIIIGLSPLGKRRLGDSTDKPEFSRLSWIAMLYSTGMGAGILLRAVQEPVFMFINPPITTSAGKEVIALEYTFYQWGFTAWAFYGLFAMVIGFYIFTKKMPSLSSSAFKLTQNNRFFLYSVDTLVIITTVFGLIAAIGLGTTQLGAGIDHIASTNYGISLSLLFTILICVIAFISVWKGIDKGIKVISRFNIGITLLLLIFVLFQTNILDMLQLFGEALYRYVIEFIPLSLALGNHDPGEVFLTDWTYYYWAFWLAWAPFTGIFIARISKGRTLRELLFGVLLIPSLGTFFWFSAFGNSAFELISEWGTYAGEFDNVFTSIYVYFDQFSFSSLVNLIVVIVLVGFLVTSVDSAIYVLSMFTDNGNKNPRKTHRALWAIFLLIFTIAILLLGSVKQDISVLTALQKLLIITSLPFSFLLLIMAFIFLKDLFRNSS